MINHILKQIWNQRKSNGWLFGELLLVAVCLWYIVDFLLVTLYAFNAPMGFDIDHTSSVHVKKVPKDICRPKNIRQP